MSTLFFQSGWGKIPAASSTQYVIDKCNPNLLINIGTCGDFKDCVEHGTINFIVHKKMNYFELIHANPCGNL
jgi:nucleoside phosphorylase